MNAEKLDVLVVDDEVEICELVCQSLARRGFTAASAHSAAEAHESMQKHSFAAALVDVLMPGGDGMELMKSIHQDHPHLPVVLMTAIATVDGAKQALRSGAFDYLQKPFDVNRLCDVMHQAMNLEEPASVLELLGSGAADGSVDSITGLMTLRRMHESLTQIRLSSTADRRNCSIVLINVDNFDDVNHMFGYAFGDQVLRQIAEGIQAKCGTRLPVAHCQGDEFAILVPDTTEGAAHQLAEQILELIRRLSLSWKGHPIFISASAGVAEAGRGFAMAEAELFDRGHRALRVAKRMGGNTACMYSEVVGENEPAVSVAAEEMSRAAEHTAKMNRRLRFACLESVRALASAVEAKDPFTHRHSEQVAYYAERLARYVGLPGDMAEVIRVASLVHDIGKIGIPDTILTKPGKLTEAEFLMVKQHPTTGANILEKISMLSTESTIVRYHHECWDGSGYPAGLAGEQIPLASRVINIADSIDAMLMRRTYKSPYTAEKVISELEQSSGKQYDPTLAVAAVEWINQHSDELILAQEVSAAN